MDIYTVNIKKEVERMSSTRLLFLIVLDGLGCVLNVNGVHQHLNPWADIVSNVKIFQKLLMIQPYRGWVLVLYSMSTNPTTNAAFDECWAKYPPRGSLIQTFLQDRLINYGQ